MKQMTNAMKFVFWIAISILLPPVLSKRSRNHQNESDIKELIISNDVTLQENDTSRIETQEWKNGYPLTFNGRPINCPCACALNDEAPTEEEEEQYIPLTTGNLGEGHHASLIVVGLIVPIIVILFLVALNSHRIINCMKCQESPYQEYSKRNKYRTADYIVRTNRRKDSHLSRKESEDRHGRKDQKFSVISL